MDEALLLRAAAKHIEEFGWQQGRFGAAGHPTCTVGATYAVQRHFSPAAIDKAHRLIRRLICKRHPGIYTNITHWNDVPTRTKEEAVQLLVEAADLDPST